MTDTTISSDPHIGEYGTYWAVPGRILDSINRYVDDNVPPGGFLTAVLSNDLAKAFGAADSASKPALPEIVRYLNNEVPAQCWGSHDKFEAWLNRKENDEKPQILRRNTDGSFWVDEEMTYHEDEDGG